MQDDQQLRLPALIALRGIPGDESAEVLQQIANNTGDPLSSTAASILEQRTKLGFTISTPPGWKRSTSGESKALP
jgi:hypothetical protein